MKKALSLILVFLIFVSLAASVSAFGVTSQYTQSKPLVLSPGEEVLVPLGLQNMVGDKDYVVDVGLILGEEIASIVGETSYNVPLGSFDTVVNVEIRIPQDALEGAKYRVGLSFITIPTDAGEGVTMGVAIDKYFNVQVAIKPVEENAPDYNTTAIWAIIIVAAIILLWWILQSKKKKHR